MKTPTVHNTLALLGLLLALSSSNTALADRWDGFGGKGGFHPGRGIGLGQVHPGPGNADGRNRSRTQVTIIVAPPATSWAPRWNNSFERRNYRPANLYRDRFGSCYEHERDRRGRIIQRRVASYYCNF